MPQQSNLESYAPSSGVPTTMMQSVTQPIPPTLSSPQPAQVQPSPSQPIQVPQTQQQIEQKSFPFRTFIDWVVRVIRVIAARRPHLQLLADVLDASRDIIVELGEFINGLLPERATMDVHASSRCLTLLLETHTKRSGTVEDCEQLDTIRRLLASIVNPVNGINPAFVLFCVESLLSATKRNLSAGRSVSEILAGVRMHLEVYAPVDSSRVVSENTQSTVTTTEAITGHEITVTHTVTHETPVFHTITHETTVTQTVTECTRAIQIDAFKCILSGDTPPPQTLEAIQSTLSRLSEQHTDTPQSE